VTNFCQKAAQKAGNKKREIKQNQRDDQRVYLNATITKGGRTTSSRHQTDALLVVFVQHKNIHALLLLSRLAERAGFLLFFILVHQTRRETNR
jgi:hypothetical protein